jgi:GT2 family glycosyltransferase
VSVLTAVSVIVATCGNAVGLERLLTSIFEPAYAPLEVLVVENRPPASNTKRVVEEHFAGTPTRYFEEKRPGLSYARNTGLTHASGDIVAFTDDDVVAHKDWIETAVEVLEREQDVACLTGRILPLSLETRAQILFDQFTSFDKGVQPRLFRLGSMSTDEPLLPYAAGQIGSGANIFVRREVALAVGRFDPALGLGTSAMGGEDLDLFIRLLQRGFGIAYDPAVIAFHDHPGSVVELRRHAFRYGVGLTAMLTKHLIYGPARLSLVKAIPGGLRHVLEPASRKNVRKSSDFPKGLEMLEYVGMLVGPAAYVVSLATSVARDRPWLSRSPLATSSVAGGRRS